MIGIILIFAFIIRVISLNQSLWLDEATTGIVARDLSLGQFFADFLPGDFHPPLYYLLVKGWGQIFGFGEIALRAPSVLFGVGSVYLVYLIGAKIKNKEIGLVAALLMASAPLHIYYSQEARFYSMTAFLVTLSVYLFLKVLGKPERRDWIYFSVSLVLIGMTDYLPLLVLPVFWMWAYLNKKGKRDWVWRRNFALSHAPLVVGFLVIGEIFMKQVSGGISVHVGSSGWWELLGKTNLKNLLLIPTKFMLGRINFPSRVVYGLFIVAFGYLSVYGVYKSKKNIFGKGRQEFLIVLWLVVPLLIGAILGFFVPVLQFFRFLFVLPAMYLIIAIGLYGLKEKHFLPIFGAILVLNLFFTMRYLGGQQFYREDWRGLTRFIGENFESENLVVFVQNSQMEGYRYYDNQMALVGGIENLEDLAETVWLMRYLQDVFDPNDNVRIKLEESGYVKESEHSFNGLLVWKYRK